MNLYTPLGILNPTEMQECLYAYTGPPPMAYGTQTAYVLENIGRPYQYYYNSTHPPTSVKTGTKRVEQITLETPSSGYNPDWLNYLCGKFCVQYQAALDLTAKEMDRILYYTPYAELSKGRQTWSFITNNNIPAANALEETVRFLEKNLNRKIGRSMLSFNQAVIDVFDLPQTSYTTETTKRRPVLNIFGDVDEEEEEIIVQETTTTISREELWKRACTLNTMLKSAERGRLNRRSIATASMLLRGFVKVVEDTAKSILAKMESAGIPVGGEEKLAKLCSKLTMSDVAHTGELSGDEEKWNECLDPDAMRTMWTHLLQTMKQPKWVIEYFNIAFLMFKNKLALMGPGLTYTEAGGKVIKKFPLGTFQSEFDFLLPLKDNDERIQCTLGMFMGMFNFSSTLLGLLATCHDAIQGSHVQSSDDFIHFTGADSSEEVLDQVEVLRLTSKMLGINMSPHKSLLIIPAGIGEFTSKYHVEDFVGNIATELPAIMPAGINPMSDLSMGLQTLKNSLVTFQILHPTADLALRIFLKAYRHAYMIEGVTRRTIFMKDNNIRPLVMYQGAENIYSISTLHLEEISFRHHLKLITDEELRRIMNPENPISGQPEAMTIRLESKMPIIERDISTGSLYKFQWARNRTILNTPHQSTLIREQEYQEISAFIEQCFPEVMIGGGNIRGGFLTACKDRIQALIATDPTLTDEQKDELNSSFM